MLDITEYDIRKIYELGKMSFEDIINDPEASFYFAKYIKQDRFPEGEEAISKSAEFSYLYAVLLGERFLAGEEAISKDPYASYNYAEDIIEGPFPLGEEAISKRAGLSFWYAMKIIKGPFPLGEEAIRQDPYWSQEYDEFLETLSEEDIYIEVD